MVHNVRVNGRRAMRALLAFSVALVASGGFQDSSASEPVAEPTAEPRGAPSTPPGPSSASGEWLRTEKNRLLTADGARFHGRGANLQDTRSCNACTYEAPHPSEVNRRVDELVDHWKANFLRLTLESYGAPDGRRSWRTALDDDAYLRDLVSIVHHIEGKSGVYVELSIWHDASLDDRGWPTDRTRALWQKLVTAFASSPRVLFGVANEPEQNQTGALDRGAWDAMNHTVETIRAAEGAGPHHIVVVQGTRMWARRLDYYVSHPITAGGGVDIAYESHTYDGRSDIDALLDGPARTLPVIIGEFGPVEDTHLAHMTMEDCAYLMERAEEREVPYMAWTFHMRCPPSLLVDHSHGTCGVGMPLEPTAWGKLVQDRLALPYGTRSH